jgi:hypothetical protein
MAHLGPHLAQRLKVVQNRLAILAQLHLRVQIHVDVKIVAIRAVFGHQIVLSLDAARRPRVQGGNRLRESCQFYSFLRDPIPAALGAYRQRRDKGKFYASQSTMRRKKFHDLPNDFRVPFFD